MIKNKLYIIAAAGILLTAANAQAKPSQVCVHPRDYLYDAQADIHEIAILNPVADELVPMLQTAGFNTVRTDSCSGFYIRLVMNSFNDRNVNGSNIYYNNGEAERAAESIQPKLIQVSQPDFPRANVFKDFSYAGPRIDVFLGFLSSSKDRNKIDNDPKSYAMAICEGMASAYGISESECMPKAVLSGKVTDNKGNPLSGVSVTTSLSSQNQSDTTDSSGSWSMRLHPGQSYKIWFSRSGYVSDGKSCYLGSSGTKDCSISLVGQNGSMCGLVVDAETNMAVTNFSVSSSPNIGNISRSGNKWDASGTPNSYQVTVSAPGYSDTVQSCAIHAGENSPSCAKFLMSKVKGQLTGTVMCDGKSVDASVTIKDLNANQTIQTIQYSAGTTWNSNSLPTGNYQVSAVPKDNKCSDGYRNCTFNADSGKMDCTVSLLTSTPGSLYGKVTDSVTGETIQAKITTKNMSGVTKTTDYAGGDTPYTIQLEPGKYEVSAHNDNYFEQVYQVFVEIHSEVDLEQSLELDPKKSQIIVKVYDTKNDMYLPAKITIKGAKKTQDKVISDEYVLFDDVIGTYEITAESLSDEYKFMPMKETRVVTANTPVEQVFRTETEHVRNNMIVGRVISSYDKKTLVPAILTVDEDETESIKVSYDGTSTNWKLTLDTDGYVTVRATPLDETAYQQNTRFCLINDSDPCIIELAPVLTYVDPEEDDINLEHSPADVDFDELGGCSFNGASRTSGSAALLFLGLAGAGLLIRRKSRIRTSGR